MDYLLALLIAFPDAVPLPDRVPPAVHAALVDFATRHDLSTPEENWKGFPFRAGVRWCHHTFLQLRDAPPSVDALNFPPAEWCKHELRRNTSCVTRLMALSDFAPQKREACQYALGSAESLRETWQIAYEAQVGFVASRRDALRRLRWKVGDADFYAGRLPPGVPD